MWYYSAAPCSCNRNTSCNIITSSLLYYNGNDLIHLMFSFFSFFFFFFFLKLLIFYCLFYLFLISYLRYYAIAIVNSHGKKIKPTRGASTVTYQIHRYSLTHIASIILSYTFSCFIIKVQDLH